MKGVKEPLNAQEEYLYAMVVRLDALCHMMSSLMEHIAEKEKVATTKSTTTRKRTPAKKKVEE